MTEYKKLVRDKIPDIIRAGGEVPNIRILEIAEYFAHLDHKLDEEVAEFHAERNLEELADILEVVYALAEGMGSDKEALEQVYSRKHEARGGFQERILLISKE
jgi:predicted house-cleaning noncanonical NTP pyrophosphatase (MazG superfamily)